ncbi:MAG: amino acid adenylation domain-containing protein, partial [bacterium]|nr:amino acid adenylation domain-containing protein [bacterium]
HLEGDIDTELFRRSYERLIEKYDVFRTAIIYKDLKQPKQVVLTKRDAEFAFHDLTLPNGSGLEEIKADDRHRGFDLLKDLLLRFTLVKTNPQNYMLMITFHHIIMDGWSTNLLLKDFIAIYHEFKNNRQPDASLPYSYSSYIQCLEDQDTGAAETYWRDYMNQFNQVTRILPIHHGVSTGNPVEFKKRNYTMELDDDTGAGLMQMARREETTLNNVIQAVWAMILNRYCGSEDVVFGTVISGRNFPLEGIDQMIGLFINTIPLRVSIHEDRQFGQLLGAIKNHLIESQRYGYLPLAEVQRHAAVEGQLLEHLYIYENFPVDQGVRSARLIDTVGFKITGRSTEEQTNYHLNLVIIPRKKIILRLQYNENVYGSSFITVLGNHIRHIIRQIINQPDLTLSDIQLVTGEEKKQLIETFNATEREFPHDKTIHQLFEEQVLKSPDHIALEMESRCLTYDELNKQSNRLARFLQQNGVKHGSIVGIILTRSLQLVTFVFAILKTGGTFLNLDPEYPKDRLDFMINDTGLQVLLVGENIHEKETRPHLNFKPLTIDPGTHDHAHAIASQDNTNITNTSSPGDPAYIIYTSGSTGIPKGVLGLHKGMVNRFNWMWTTYPFKANDVCCQKTSMNFVDCLWETFGPLLKGLPLVIIPKNVIIDLPAFVHILETRQVTRIVLVPGLLYWFFDDNTGYYKKLPHLTLWVSSGETLQPGFPALFREAAPQSTLLNIYGSSEISADVTCYNTTDTPGGREDGLLTVPIGRPIDNTQIYILNEARSPVPIGIAGEIYAGGVGLAAGYLNQPELTMERFNHDFKDFKDDRDIKKEKIEPTSSYEVNLYRTGDLARWLEDGNIEYLGRKDRQVKIRGFRIEIGEIEGQLRVHPGIKEAVVIDRKNKGSQDLCAYFVPLEEEILTVDLLKEYLKNKLPDYMIPSYFVPIETIPLTSTNKVNRKALPEPGQGLATGAVYEAPGTPVEEKLVSIWQEILNVDRIGINDDFFNLGGHSIKVIRLTGYIKRDFNVDFSLQAVFKHTTIKAQARFISSSEHSRYNPIEAAGTRDHYPVSPVQKRMYLIQQLDPASSAYNIYRSYVVKGAFDRDRLVTAINRMVSRHDVLRTSFEMVKGEPMQRINEADTLGLIIDYAEEVFQGPSTAQYTGLIESFIRPYNLSRAPLFRVKLSRLHPDEYLLVIDMHHIITDFASMEILIRDLMQAYQHDGADETQEPANSIQYRDYTVWQQEVITENRLKEQETFWLERFSGNIPALDFPTDYPRPQIQSDAGDRFNIDADKELTLKLNLLARGTGTTLYMVLLAAYNVLLSKFTGQEDIIVSAPIENRPDIRLDNVVGIFLNTLSFRNNPQKTKPFDTFLEEVKETVVKSFENQDYPFEELVNQLDLQGNLSRIPLFDTLFNLLNVDRLVERQVGSLTFRPFRPRKPAVKFDINIAISEIEERLKVSCQYRTTLFKRRSIQYLMSEYLRLLEFISNDPRKQIKQYAIFNPSDLSEDTRASWAEVKPGMPNDQFSRKEIQQSIAQRFEEQVKRNPGGLAVKTQDTTMTYLELNKAANRIAHVIGAQLSELSGTGQPVALLFGHGAAMVSAVFGVLKSGNPYFPLDSEHPEERLLFMLRDSFTPLMLTDTLNLPLAEHLRQHTGRDIKILNIDTLDANLPDENPSIAVDPGQPAYILYTSGTTGNPKGVLQAHCNVLHFMRNYANNLRIDQTDKLTLFATYTFDAAMMDMFGALLNGAALFPYDLKAEKQLANLSQWLNDEGITVFHSTPTLFRYFVDALSSESQFPSVRLVVLGGEAVTRSAFEDYKTHFPDHCILANNYGPTESTTVYMNILDKEADITGETVPIGFPIDDTDVYLLDENNEETPVYQVGELVYSSRYLALGYVNQPFKTAEVFIANPVTGSGRAYRSGDLGQLLPDGTVRFIGRNDSQIKIRGYRVELKEIELQLSKLENIGNCAVTLVTNEDGENHLAAYYVPSDGIKEAPASNKIQDFLTLHLPSYMVPNYYVPMEEIPLTTTGKIDWKSLPAPDAGLEAQREYIAPSTSTQEQLVTIWQELLKTKKQIGITDNFFQLGGHSLRAMNMTVKIQEAFGVDIALKEIFNHPYINHIAELIDEEVDKLKKFEQILKEIEEMGG